jgi:hypothetical protein
MTAMSRECDICDHECAGFELGEDIFFADTDGDSAWLSQIGNCSCKKCPVFYGIEYAKYLFSECFTVFPEKLRKSCNTIDTRIWR